jgi:hypothetical protein
MGLLTSFSAAKALDGLPIPTNPFQKPLFQKSILQNSLLLNESESEKGVCTQFSGKWKGPCEGTEGRKSLQLIIDQVDCSNLIVDGTNYSLDGMETSATSQGGSVVNGSTALSWINDKTKLAGNTQSLGQVVGKYRTIKFLFKNKFTLEKEKDTLMLSTEAQTDTYQNDFKKIQKDESTCRLERVIDPPKDK